MTPVASPAPRDALIEQFLCVRRLTERLAAPLSDEDQGLQAAPWCSPTKWHRAHTTWFFETFLLVPGGITPYDDRWGYLFNSYYESVGPRHARPRRGMLSRPSVAEITGYRRAIDERMIALISGADPAALERVRGLVELGLVHEQQHQELLLTDVLCALDQSPLRPRYRAAASPSAPPARGGVGDAVGGAGAFVERDGGLVEIGAPRSGGFRFDNEEPRHRAWLEPFSLADRLVTVAEWKAFADAGGYTTPSLWLSEGYEWAQATGARAPQYARREGGALVVFGLDGEREALDAEPVAHVSYYEADAVARFLDARLPTEVEWEHVAAGVLAEGNFLEDDALRAQPAGAAGAPFRQLFGDVWEWTSSSYAPYPGYHPPAGAVGEYNGKFMVNQMVLRGGSCFTPRGHVRATYRNFWHPDTRFQMSGIRLARSRPG
jgi:ergothioneine biosynthesis protein EgtB